MKRIILLLSFFLSSQAIALPIPSAPNLKARSYHLTDFHSGTVLASKDPDLKLAPASMTKIMTALIVFRELNHGNLNLDDQVRISEKAWRTPGSRMFVEVNKFVTVDDLIHGMLVQSGNDATVALAEHIAGDESTFAQLMNQVAKDLGMKNSHFTNSSGLPDEQHYTTARDLSVLTRALIIESPELYKINAIKSFSFNGITQQNRNKLLWRDSTVDGVKTGHTEDAGYCLVSSAVRDNMRLISVVMGTDSVAARNDINQALLNYGYRFYKTHLLYKAQQSLTTTRVWKGAIKSLPVGLAKDLYLTIPRNEYKSLDASLELNPQLIAPIKKGQLVGNAVIQLKGDIIAKRPLIALQDIPEGSFMDILKDEALLLLE
ncbi:MAG: D-alanyl-D-alanine carboxypeptidase (penicillin-binding protein 5/6) [Cycloclasticus pugetii]|jgi:D-alanyl-D-alanine carboxypeptidase (penicillin-binding protein 5/6)|uniref:serine-type D-Ala-D-Ala carboxypeptidase n=1 Tax=Cycloclasticus zancles 78-ME TaxID=1198232 RepID=S5TVB5_9GAMM|nr:MULTISPECIES: D-alanyl-D-alanine carboxypeptidase family protein [Cycloclasticus]AGS39045.1 D-alanyl-D-alanine carboxypeptidase [Cycloclasticus zancles 78-ME]MBV1899043.1 D-alanyl-D-alanine carboxypeptidase [Cycloclasticus sp.]MDF1829951.1 D-alanyl-D-alanine carboxypeptidase [Cycloclasticus pugetii]PHR51034.1 MAG: D-alanyl-D-alanine carboxypeptidase [Cycloclasticus sp.]SHI56724.1 penicillin-binding protein 6. Serine peptidase. MEROPS family S11 [Cycloclasticus pugetii]